MTEEKWKEESREIKSLKRCVFKERQSEQTKEITKKKDGRKQICKKKETERKNGRKREIKNNECVKMMPESNIQKLKKNGRKKM